MKNVFLFPGNGIHQKKMLSILCGAVPMIADRLRELDNIASKYYPVHLLDEDKDDEIIDQIRVFASEVAISEFWEALGCSADYCVGHSLGEYAEAVYCGILHSEDAVFMLSERAKCLEEETPHATAVSETSAKKILSIAEENGYKIYISAYNAPETVTVCGHPDDLLALTQICKEMRLRFGIINKFHGSHYPGLCSGAEKFMETVSQVDLVASSKNMLQTIYPENEDITPSDREYWCKHICNSVNLVKALRRLPENEEYRVIDLGISPVLLAPAQKCLDGRKAVYIPTIRMGRNYRQQILNAVDMAEKAGININRSILG